MRNTKVEFVGATGALLAARLDLPSRPTSAVALFAHCFTCSKSSKASTAIADALVAEGIAVLRFDFTGLGNSEGDFGNTDFASNIEDLLSAADWLDANYSAPSLLVGHSLGGAAVIAAAPHLSSVRAIATVGAPADPTHVLRHLVDDATATASRGSSDTSDRKIDIGGRTFRVSNRFLSDLEQFPATRTIPTLDSALVVFHSPADDIVDLSNGQQIFDLAQQPKSFVSLGDADHLLTNRDDGTYVGDVLASWARRYLAEQPLDVDVEMGDAGVSPVAPDHIVVSERGGGTFQNLVETPDHHLHADEPVSVGGTNTGPNPYELLLASLGTCTSMTIRMYADRKEIPLRRVSVELKHDRIHAKDCEECETDSGMVDVIDRTLTITGEMSDEQRQDLLRIADRCPVHKTLTGQIRVRTTLS